MAEALQYPFITYRNVLNNYNRNMLLEYNKGLDILQLDDRESLCRYLRKSQAVTSAPLCTFYWDQHYLDGGIKSLQITDLEWITQVGIIYRKDETLSIEQQEFAALLMQKIPLERLRE